MMGTLEIAFLQARSGHRSITEKVRRIEEFETYRVLGQPEGFTRTAQHEVCVAHSPVDNRIARIDLDGTMGEAKCIVGLGLTVDQHHR
ncbi:hypothetical protein FJ938_27965 [Mesorhizobium sp. B2-4-14]|nr:hypothetical protein FJ938_27965 [Mesorhizobium sp. B2-4-14]